MVKKQEIIEALKNVYDPEIPVSVVDLGLIYDIKVDEDNGTVFVKMTLTAPGCPMASFIMGDVEMVIRELEGVKEVKVELTYDPPWSSDLMSSDAKKNLGYE